MPPKKEDGRILLFSFFRPATEEEIKKLEYYANEMDSK